MRFRLGTSTVSRKAVYIISNIPSKTLFTQTIWNKHWNILSDKKKSS